MYRLTIFLAIALFSLHVYAGTINGTEHRAAHRRRLDRREADFEAFKQDVVDSHNSARSGFGPAPQVTWSDELYPDTHAYASECRFEHSDGHGQYGENLAAGEGDFDYEGGIKLWMDESDKYDYRRPRFSKEAGHFTQVVWKDTQQVACASVKCPPGTIFEDETEYIVCRYLPPGNVDSEEEFRKNVGRPVRRENRGP